MGDIFDLPQRIIDKIDIRSDGECWEWKAAKQTQGYGMVYFEGKYWLATRLVYQVVQGPLHDQDFVCHACDNPSCVNPSHLFAGDQLKNMRDCKIKGRNPRGESHNFAKLTEADVLAIRADPRNHNQTSKAYGISRETVRNIRQRRTWQHLPEKT